VRHLPNEVAGVPVTIRKTPHLSLSGQVSAQHVVEALQDLGVNMRADYDAVYLQHSHQVTPSIEAWIELNADEFHDVLIELALPVDPWVESVQ
jgi:hypothetical protein